MPSQAISVRRNDWLSSIVLSDEFAIEHRHGGEPAYLHTTPEEYGRIIARDIGVWSKVIREGNVKVD